MKGLGHWAMGRGRSNGWIQEGRIQVPSDLSCVFKTGRQKLEKHKRPSKLVPSPTGINCSPSVCQSVCNVRSRRNELGIKNSGHCLHLRLCLWSCPQMDKIRYLAEKGTGPTNQANESHINEDILQMILQPMCSKWLRLWRNKAVILVGQVQRPQICCGYFDIAIVMI